MTGDFHMKPAAGHLSDDEIIGFLHRTPSSGAEKHLLSCDKCRTELDAYRRTIEALQHWPAPECAADYEDHVWSRISQALPRRRQTFWARIPVRAFGLAAAIAAISVVSFSVYRTHPQPSLNGVVSQAPVAGHRILDVAVRDHFERTSRVLSELENSKVPDSVHVVDISGEQNTVDDLLAENRLYRQTAEQEGDRPTAHLLENVEQLLVELDHAPPEIPAPQLQNFQKHLSDTDVLFKLKVFTSLNPDSNSPQSPITKL
jgi:hypothetical protein